ncbi:hypothetical protein DYB26_001456 [Aphanomyces astaci]|uniref:Uncharacterized protein n=1 Tax=Aphanomyces astaci TaxID=112090 RepID=A0A3R6ZAQ4_APHAT|nr:hypothetical protein DYB26_001456 [Aphanomyces astaci]
MQLLQLGSSGRFVLRMLDLVVPNVKRQHLYVLLCRTKVTSLTKSFLSTFERSAERLLLADGPDGQLKGCHLRSFDHPLDHIMDVRRIQSIVVCKPATAKPPSVVADLHLFANLVPYAHMTPALEQSLADKASLLAAKQAQDEDVAHEDVNNLQHAELDIPTLQACAHELFRMFDRDRSGTIEFAEDRDNCLNVLEYELALKTLRVQAPKAAILRRFPSTTRLITLEAFQLAWVALVDVPAECAKRKLLPLPPPPRLMNRVLHPRQRTRQLQAHLLAALAAQAAEEVAAAVAARDVVLEIGRLRAAERQAAQRQILHLKRGEEVELKTKEALREREEKMLRRRARNAKVKLVQEEKRLVAQVDADRERRKQMLMSVRTEALVRRRDDTAARRAARGDNELLLANRRLADIPPELFHGKAALLELSNMVIVDLAHNKLTHLPDNFAYNLDSVQKLDVSFNHLEVLPADIGQLHALRLLNVRGNRLTSLPFSFSRLDQLEIADLSSNTLQSLRLATDHNPNQVTKALVSWANLKMLHVLYVGDNALATLPMDLSAAPKLAHLDLVGNPLSRLPLTFRDCASLVTFDVSKCSLKHLSTEFGSHPLLQVVDMGHNMLSHLPPSVAGLTAMQQLSIVHNELLALPDAVGGWGELVMLDASSNRIRVLPDEIGCWRQVEALHLNHNRLVSLPRQIGCLVHLHTLHLRDNALVELPLDIGALSALRHCDLSRNKLTALPSQFGFCHALRTLDVSDNALETLPSSVGMWMALETLHLQYNRLMSPLPDTVVDWMALRVLDLSHNNLTHLDRAICALTRLESLNMAKNRLEFLPADIGGMVGLQMLDLYHNALHALPMELSSLLPTLEVLHVDGNPMSTLPEKWCTRWRLQDRYRTQFAHGYSQPEALEWTQDHAIYYPVVVATWNAHADEYMAHVLLVGAFLDAVRTTLSDSWQPRFEKPVKTHFFEFKYQGHPTLYDDADDDVREAHRQQEAAQEAARDAAATATSSETNALEHVLDERYAVNVVEAEKKSAVKREIYRLKKADDQHRTAKALQGYIQAHAGQRNDEEARRHQLAQHEFAERLKLEALQQEVELQRQYSVPDQTKWAFYHRTGRYLDDSMTTTVVAAHDSRVEEEQSHRGY